MYKPRWLSGVLATAALSAAVVVIVGGCEKPVREARVPSSTSEPPSVAATQPAGDPTTAAAVIRPESNPVETQPVLATLTIDGIGAQFPPTKLLIHARDKDEPLRCELFSDLPKSALRKYDGNELYFEMTPAAPDGSPAEKVEGSLWRFKAPNSEKTDSPNGLFLSGQATHLQPSDVWVKFERQPGPDGHASGQLTADIMGQFRAFEAGQPAALAPFVGVSGRLTVEIVQKR